MENYVGKTYPTKAGVYAVKNAPIMAKNILRYIKSEPLVKYVP